ncbi:hypothetical protein CLAFUR4_03834 [Fulvia fulva]|nr:hypothetical protein CLAFUR4_03834 [Fulvia fulva]WPV26797.1 hypothetical protein CLAFUW7_03838 [Fulvia fulva]
MASSRANEVLKDLVGALDLCRVREERNLGDGDAESTKHDFDIEYDESTISKVRFTDCEVRNVHVKDCNWNNVTFTDCRFSDTTFNAVKLENAHLYNVDFHQVTFDKIEFKDVRWTGEYLDNAFVSTEHLGYADGHGGLPVRVLHTSRHSRTTGGFNYRGERRAERKEELLARSELTQVELVVSQRPQTELLKLPDNVFSTIVGILCPPGRVRIVDFPKGLKAPLPTEQTTYLVKRAGRIDRCTYLGWPMNVTASSFIGNAEEAPSLELCANLLRVNWKRYNCSVDKLYDRTFHFHGSANACLAFLHDHPARIKRVRISGLGFTTSWSRIATILTYGFPELESLTIQWDDSFWDTPSWKDLCASGAADSLITSAVNDGFEDQEDAMLSTQLADLRHVASIPFGAAPRLIIYYYIRGQEHDGTRKSLVRKLNVAIHNKRVGLSVPPVIRHICSMKQLEQCPFGVRPPTHLFDLPQSVLTRIFRHAFPAKGINILD